MVTSYRTLYLKIAIALFLLVSATSYSQQYLGTISGEVTDPSGAKVPGATVEVTDIRTHFKTSTKSNSTGLFNVPFLQPGTYTVHISATGFSPAEQTDVILTSGDIKQISMKLSLGETQQTVNVSSNHEQLETGTATIGDTITVQEVTDLPNIGRNPLNVNTLSPGVYSPNFAQAKTSFSSQPFGGIAVGAYVNGIPGKGRVILNGIPDDPPERGTVGNYTGFAPSPEAVQEVTTQTMIYDSQFGRSAGAITNTVLRTGANRYHGALYYTFQNTYLNANTYERVPTQNDPNPGKRTPRTNNQWNQPGFVVDGPVQIPHIYNGRDKTFFMVALERVQNSLAVNYFGNVPSEKMRTGDFSELLGPGGSCTGSNICLYDPNSNTGGGHRTLIPGNDLTALGNPVGMALVNSYPHPNHAGTGLAGLTDNYISTQTSSPDHYYSLAVRVDQQINPSNKIDFVYIRNRRTQSYSNQGFGTGGGPGYIHTRNNEGGAVELITLFSPKLVLNSRVGAIYHPFTLTRYGYRYDITQLGFPSSLASQLPIQTFPGVSVSDNFKGLSTGQSQFSGSTLLDASEILSQTLGRHSLHYGIAYEMLRDNTNTPTSGLGSFAFNRGFTQENGSVGANSQSNSGFGMASMWLGYPASGTQQTNATSALQQHYFALFVQDDWRVNSKLTLNLGLRYDLEQPFTERHNQINVDFCQTCASPLNIPGLPLQGGLLFASDAHRFPYQMHRLGFQPRIGAAYQIDRRQVLRAGFGIMYMQSQDLPTTLGYSSTTAYPATVDGITPFTSLSNPYPSGLSTPLGSAGGLLTQVGAGVTYQDRAHAVPKLYYSSLSLQTQFPGDTVVDISFVSNMARNQELSRNMNALPASNFPLGATYLQTPVPNPMAGHIPSNATLNAATIQRRYLLLPYPQFTSVNETSIPRGITNYFAMQDRVTKRMSHNLSLHANFTWAKIMKNDFLNDTDANPTYYQDAQPNLFFNLTAIYMLPKFGTLNHYARFFLGGWQANSILRAQNGIAVSNPANVIPLRDPATGVQPTFAKMFNNCYIKSNGDPSATCNGSTVNAAFRQEENAAYTVQTIHPYMDHVRNKIKPRLDFSLFKKFPIHESATFEIRGEFFNILNSANFSPPNTTITSPDFGIVPRTQSNDPRIGQLTARFNF